MPLTDALDPTSRTAAPPLSRWARRRAPWLLATGGLALMVLLLASTWSVLTPIFEDIARIEDRRLPKLQLLLVARSGDLDASVALRNMLLARDPQLDRHEQQRFETTSRSAAAAIEQMAAMPMLPEERQLFDATTRSRGQLAAVRQRGLDIERRGTIADPDALTRELQSALDDYLGQLGRLQSFQTGRLVALVDGVSVRADRVRVLLVVCALVAALTLLAAAAAWRAALWRETERRDEHIATLRQQKDALVGEVHHRIKNHLQGLLGLIETHQRAERDAVVAGRLAGLHGHVLALVGIHGLQAVDPSRQLTVKDLIRQQVELATSGLPGARIALSEDAGLEDVVVPQESAVPLALIVTELIVNAVKHGDGSPVRVRVGPQADGGVLVAVRNALAAPTALDWPAGRGLGTGLGLVATLAEGLATITQGGSGGEIEMALRVPRSVTRPAH